MTSPSRSTSTKYKALGVTVIGVSGDSIAMLAKSSVSECRANSPSGIEEIAAVLRGCTADLPAYLPTASKHDWRFC
jgi:hypothetical protein